MAVCGPPIAHLDVQSFYPFPCPWGASQELETRCNAWVMSEAPNINLLAQGRPSIESHQVSQQSFQGDAMKRIIRLRSVHRLRLPGVVRPVAGLFIVIPLNPFHSGVLDHADDAFRNLLDLAFG
jgi:hypothetical protein